MASNETVALVAVGAVVVVGGGLLAAVALTAHKAPPPSPPAQQQPAVVPRRRRHPMPTMQPTTPQGPPTGSVSTTAANDALAKQAAADKAAQQALVDKANAALAAQAEKDKAALVTQKQQDKVAADQEVQQNNNQWQDAINKTFTVSETEAPGTRASSNLMLGLLFHDRPSFVRAIQIYKANLPAYLDDLAAQKLITDADRAKAKSLMDGLAVADDVDKVVKVLEAVPVYGIIAEVLDRLYQFIKNILLGVQSKLLANGTKGDTYFTGCKNGGGYFFMDQPLLSLTLPLHAGLFEKFGGRTGQDYKPTLDNLSALAVAYPSSCPVQKVVVNSAGYEYTFSDVAGYPVTVTVTDPLDVTAKGPRGYKVVPHAPTPADPYAPWRGTILDQFIPSVYGGPGKPMPSYWRATTPPEAWSSPELENCLTCLPKAAADLVPGGVTTGGGPDAPACPNGQPKKYPASSAIPAAPNQPRVLPVLLLPGQAAPGNQAPQNQAPPPSKAPPGGTPPPPSKAPPN
jgi:hypothetical protein